MDSHSNDQPQVETKLEAEEAREVVKSLLAEAQLISVAAAAKLSDDLEAMRRTMHTIEGNMEARDSIILGLAASIDEMKKVVSSINIEQLHTLLSGLSDIQATGRLLNWVKKPLQWLVGVSVPIGVIWGWLHLTPPTAVMHH